MFRTLIATFLPFTLVGLDVELRTMTQDETLPALVLEAMKAQDLVVTNSVQAKNGIVIYWGTPNDGGTQLDEITIYDYKRSLFPDGGGGRAHNGTILRSLYRLQWTRNGLVSKSKQVEMISHLIHLFCDGSWPRPADVVVTNLHADDTLKPDLKNSLQNIRQDPLSVKAYVLVHSADLKDDFVIRDYSISRITNDLSIALEVMGKKRDMGLVGRLEVMRFKNGAPINADQIATISAAVMAAELK